MVSLTSLLPAAIVAAGSVLAQAPAAEPRLAVTVHNDLAIERRAETIELTASQLTALGGDPALVRVFESGTDREVLAQALDLDADGKAESLVFQTDVPASGMRAFELRPGEKRVYRKDDFRVYGRFVRERFDDFAWENDRVAHRMYGTALETWQREPLTSSALDVWFKRTRRLVINDWYMTDDYHRDTGEGADLYSAGRSRGCGGSGLWRDGKLVVSKNFRSSRVLANGPIRLVFELDYPAWDDSGVRAETKRVTLDAGQNFNRFESRYDADGELQFAAGIKKQPATSLRVERERGWLRTWEPIKDGGGNFGCAVIVPPSSVAAVAEADNNHLLVARAKDRTAMYYAGSGWDRSGDFAGVEDWDRYIEQWAQRISSPLRVEVTAR